MDGGGCRIVETGEGRRGSPELATPAASGLGGDGRVADGARGVTPQPVMESPMAAGAHSGGGGSPEGSRQHRVVDLSL